MPKLYPSNNDYESVATTYEYICIAPSSIWFTKQFPINKWRELIRKIPQRYKIHLIGSSEDVAFCKEIQIGTDIERITISAGQLTFLQSAALIENAKMTFTNDSAPLHFASAVNAPVTAIYCATIPQFGFSLLSDIAHIVETDEKLDCRP